MACRSLCIRSFDWQRWNFWFLWFFKGSSTFLWWTLGFDQNWFWHTLWNLLGWNIWWQLIESLRIILTLLPINLVDKWKLNVQFWSGATKMLWIRSWFFKLEFISDRLSTIGWIPRFVLLLVWKRLLLVFHLTLNNCSGCLILIML